MSKTDLAQDLFMPLIYKKARCAALVAYNKFQSTHQYTLRIAGVVNAPEMEARRFDLILWC